ncbi:MAG: hypothetical protein ACXVQR_03275 [Solirubrobacteraceae bacterium]
MSVGKNASGLTDLSVFDRSFGLPDPPAFRVLQPLGPVPSFDPTNQAW